MIDKQKQIDYCISGASSDLETAEILIKNNKFLHGLFFCHLVIEKALKAHITSQASDYPPKSHNLILLLEKTNLELSESYLDLLGVLMKYQLEGRYPDYNPATPGKEKIMEYFNTTNNLFEWLKERF